MTDNTTLPARLRATVSRSKRELLDAAADEIESLTMLLNEARENIRALQSERRWISVEERLPEIGQKVLACGVHHGMEVQQYHGSRFAPDGHCVWVWKHNTLKTVTHWMPLPKIPKEEHK